MKVDTKEKKINVDIAIGEVIKLYTRNNPLKFYYAFGDDIDKIRKNVKKIKEVVAEKEKNKKDYSRVLNKEDVQEGIIVSLTEDLSRPILKVDAILNELGVNMDEYSELLRRCDAIDVRPGIVNNIIIEIDNFIRFKMASLNKMDSNKPKGKGIIKPINFDRGL